MQNWFSGGVADNSNSQPKSMSSSSSLLADWNSYAAARSSEETNSGGSLAGVFDIEAAVRSANDSVSGTFNVVSKGVRELPGNLQSATSGIPSGKALMHFGLLLASGVFFVFIAFTLFLPVIVLVPQKFAICFTVGCGFIIGSFFALRGPKNQFNHMASMERLPFTLGFLGSSVVKWRPWRRHGGAPWHFSASPPRQACGMADFVWRVTAPPYTWRRGGRGGAVACMGWIWCVWVAFRVRFDLKLGFSILSKP